MINNRQINKKLNITSRLNHYNTKIKHYSGDSTALLKYLLFVFNRSVKFLHKSLSSSNKNISSQNQRYWNVVKDRKEIKRNILGNKMILPTKDRGLSRDLILNGVREEEVIKLIKKLRKENSLIDRNSVVVEIGANIGYYALIWGNILKEKEGFLYAIEPNPYCFEYLKKNVKLNNLKNVMLINKGVSDKRKSCFFRMDKEWNLSKIAEKGENKSDCIKMEFESLDNLFKDKEDISLIRMDVEGHEYNILKGAKNILRSNTNLRILMEYHPSILSMSQKREIINILKKNGFKIKYFTDMKGRIREGGNLRYLKSCIHSAHFLFEK
ncbi:MAG: FkbM family methyltransferase [Candidatus Pacearchaeota archaeon]